MRRKAVLLAPTQRHAYNFMFDRGIRLPDRNVIVITGMNEADNVRGLPPDDTPWYCIHGDFENLREIYVACELRFGPVWSEQTFVGAIID
jgi:hypothetical protein